MLPRLKTWYKVRSKHAGEIKLPILIKFARDLAVFRTGVNIFERVFVGVFDRTLSAQAEHTRRGNSIIVINATTSDL